MLASKLSLFNQPERGDCETVRAEKRYMGIYSGGDLLTELEKSGIMKILLAR